MPSLAELREQSIEADRHALETREAYEAAKESAPHAKETIEKLHAWYAAEQEAVEVTKKLLAEWEDRKGSTPLQKGGIVAMHTVYAVVENMPGYLPESEPVWFDTKTEAEAYAKERDDEIAEEEEETEQESPYIVDIIAENVPLNIDAEMLNHPEEYKKELEEIGMQEGGVVEPDKGSFRKAGYRFEWNFAHTVNVYDSDGRNVDVFSVGDFAKDTATQAEVERGIDNWLQYRESLQEGAAIVESVGPGVPAVIGEAGPEAVIPLDDPAAVEVMAEAISEGTDRSEVIEVLEELADFAELAEEAAETIEESAEEVEKAAEEVEEAAEEVLEEAVAEGNEEVAEEMAEVIAETSGAEAESETASVEAAEAAAVAEVIHPAASHWYFRLIGSRR